VLRDGFYRLAARHSAATRRVPLDDLRDVADHERRALARADDGRFDVGGALKIAAAAHDELALTVLNVAARRGAVRSLHGVDEILERDSARAKAPRIGEH